MFPPSKSVDLGAGFLNLASCSLACEDCRQIFWTRNDFVTNGYTSVWWISPPAGFEDDLTDVTLAIYYNQQMWAHKIILAAPSLPEIHSKFGRIVAFGGVEGQGG